MIHGLDVSYNFVNVIRGTTVLAFSCVKFVPNPVLRFHLCLESAKLRCQIRSNRARADDLHRCEEILRSSKRQLFWAHNERPSVNVIKLRILVLACILIQFCKTENKSLDLHNLD